MYKSDLLLREQGGVEGVVTGWDVLYERRIYFQLEKFLSVLLPSISIPYECLMPSEAVREH